MAVCIQHRAGLLVLASLVGAAIFAAPAAASPAPTAAAPPAPAPDKVISTTELTQAFHTRRPWKFVVTQAPQSASDPYDEETWLSAYFVAGTKTPLQRKACCDGLVNTLDHVLVVYPSKTAARPLLVLESNDENGGPGSYEMSVVIWAYRAGADAFEQVWAGQSYRPRNEETRLITSGPLAGDLVVAIDDPTHRWPWPYGVRLYRRAASGRYVQAFYFIGKSAQVGGPPGAVIDADMPELYRRLRLPPGKPSEVPLTN